MKILVAEDDYASALVLEKALARAGYQVTTAQNGAIAQTKLKEETFDLLLTDWMMPELDGLELIRWVRKELKPVPAIAMLTVISNPEARAHAFLAGADEFVAKPFRLEELLKLVENLVARRRQMTPTPVVEEPPATIAPNPDRVPLAVVIAAGTGGPEVLQQLLPTLPENLLSIAHFSVVQHGPDWLLYDLAERLGSMGLRVHLTEEGQRPNPGNVYLAHGEAHLTLANDPVRFHLSRTDPVNFMRPAADVLFRSAAATYGDRTLAVVLSGIGCDGTLGAERILQHGGRVLIQDPETATADTMPRAVKDQGLEVDLASPDRLTHQLTHLAELMTQG